MPSSEGLSKAMKPELDKVFKPAFLGRLVIIPYYPVRDENLKQIVRLKLGKIQRRLMENHHIAFNYDPAMVDEVARRCTEVESEVSKLLLTKMAEGNKPSHVNVTVGEDGKFAYELR